MNNTNSCWPFVCSVSSKTLSFDFVVRLSKLSLGLSAQELPLPPLRTTGAPRTQHLSNKALSRWFPWLTPACFSNRTMAQLRAQLTAATSDSTRAAGDSAKEVASLREQVASLTVRPCFLCGFLTRSASFLLCRHARPSSA